MTDTTQLAALQAIERQRSHVFYLYEALKKVNSAVSNLEMATHNKANNRVMEIGSTLDTLREELADIELYESDKLDEMTGVDKEE